jgi:HEAT repeat protein
LSLSLSLASPLGCDSPTPDKIAHWKETERGPRKLRDALQSGSVDASLRGQALAALVELGMTSDAIADLAKLSDEDRRSIIHEAVPRLGTVARGTGIAGSATTRAQREAKDALFQLRSDGAAADKDAIDQALIEWTTADLAGRMSAGGNSSDKILTAIGAKAAPRLAELLQPGSQQLIPSASILGRIGDPDTRARAADTLIQKLRAAGPRGLDDESVQALGLVGGPRATAFLVDTAEHAPAEEKREKALYALAQGSLSSGDSAAQAAAVRIAADKKVPGKVREAAFQLAEKIGPTAVSDLVKLMHDSDETVRWRSVEAALAAGKDKAVVPVLEALNPAGKYKREDLDSYVVHDLVQVGPSATVPLQTELSSKNPVARQVAQAALTKLGKR